MTPERSASVSLRGDLLHQLRAIESHAHSLAEDLRSTPVESHAQDIANDLCVTALVDRAVRAFLAPIVAAIDQNESPHLTPSLDDDYDYDYVDLDGDLITELDRVVAHAAVSGHGGATRSRLVTDAMRAFLDGFGPELGP